MELLYRGPSTTPHCYFAVFYKVINIRDEFKIHVLIKIKLQYIYPKILILKFYVYLNYAVYYSVWIVIVLLYIHYNTLHNLNRRKISKFLIVLLILQDNFNRFTNARLPRQGYIDRLNQIFVILRSEGFLNWREFFPSFCEHTTLTDLAFYAKLVADIYTDLQYR